ncbi:MAG TPA: aminoglycoside phosphotransferase family protein [Aliidongia sp.]|nr:aminoglycoside phosphotransferase family protein [Aliidongia sp.]
MTEADFELVEPVIDGPLVLHLIAEQFPHWTDLPVHPVANSGWDNRTFHLGNEMLVRLPSRACYAAQVEKEQRWLPELAPLLPLSIPVPLAMGEPGASYPWRWSVYRWLPGETAAPERIDDMSGFARDLGAFLLALQHIDPAEGPSPGPDNFYRGGPLATYDGETRQAIASLKGRIDTGAAVEVWEEALRADCQGTPVWFHGDVSAGNLLVNRGRLSAVIDFGALGVGDPACDLSIAWTLFTNESRDAFRASLGPDPATWSRGRAWALWKALIVAAGLTQTNAVEAAKPWRIIEEVLASKGTI